MTTGDRFFPPTFGVRNWYIMRRDRLSQGSPDRRTPEESRGFAIPGPVVEHEELTMKKPSVKTSAPQLIGVGIDTARYGHRVTFLRDDRQPATAPLTIT